MIDEQQGLLTQALYLALTAPTDEQCDEAVELAKMLAPGLTWEQVQSAQVRASAKFLGPKK